MDKSLLDTDIFSEFLKGKNETVKRHATAYLSQFGRLTISAITLVEVVKGFHKKGPATRIEKLLEGLKNDEVLALDADAAVLAGKIYADLEKTGRTIGRADPIIASVAIASGLVLVTGNTEHFERIKALGYDLKLENWRDAP